MSAIVSRNRRARRGALLVFALVFLGGCAARNAYKSGQREMRRQNYDSAILDFSKALALDPGNARFGVALARAKVNSSSEHFQRGKRYQAAGQLELAIAEFQQVLLLDPGHQYAANELKRAAKELQARDSLPSEIEQIKERARQRDLGPPRLDAKTNIPILLNFADVKIGKIFEAIGKAAGINFIFDDKTDLDKPMTIDIGNVSLEQALDILMMQTKNFFKVIDEYTLLIAPDTRQKRQEYEDQVIRTFFLSNGDTKQVTTLLRSLLQARQIAENADLNSITIKDTPDKVAIAERIIQSNDKSKGEVLIDVELLEINRSLARTMGIDLSSKTLALTFRGGAASVPLNNLKQLNQAGNWTIGVIPTVVLDFLRTDGDTRVIAKPQLRVAEGEQAEILIGDRVPIPTTSFNTSSTTVGGTIVPLTSFTYQNVGITVQIEPRVHHNKEITLKVQVEISQLGAPVETSSGQTQPTIGTRQIQTVIRLRDGETNMLAGLIQRENADSVSGVPGLSDIPGLRRIFGSTTQTKRETDIIMTLTPRIIRVPDITEDDLATLWVGTEENMQLRGPARNALNQSPFALPEPPPSPLVPGAGEQPDLTPVPPRRGGSLNRITPSEAVEREREQQAAAAQANTPPEPSTPSGPSGGVGGAPPPPRPVEPVSPEEEPIEPEPLPGPAVIRIVPAKTLYNVGETVVVDVFIENGTNVGSVPFHLRYDPDVLQFVSPGIEGPFLGADGTATVFLARGSGGEVVVGLSRLGGGEGASGNGSLATFQFLAIGEGDAQFAFTGASVKDPQAGSLPASFSVVAVRVEP